MTRFLLGLGLGAAIGALIAPASGEETRRRLVEKAEDFRDEKLGEVIRSAREKTSQKAREASEHAVDEAAAKVAGERAVERSHRPA